MESSDRSIIAGVFRDHARADHAVEQLKQAGFSEEQCSSTVYSLGSGGKVIAAVEHAPGTRESRFVVAVHHADGREGEALSILLRNGANNTDLLPGIALVNGVLVSEHPETTDLIPEQNVDATAASYSFFGEAQNPGHPGELGIEDETNFLHG